jgi:hypothetical protein
MDDIDERVAVTAKLTENGNHADIRLNVTVDGVDCGGLTICSGPARDVEDVWRHNCGVNDLMKRWALRGKLKS